MSVVDPLSPLQASAALRERVAAWRALAAEEKTRRRRSAVVDEVVGSMRMEDEPVSDEWASRARRRFAPEADPAEPRSEAPRGRAGMNDLVADALCALVDDVQAGRHAGRSLDVDLVRDFHRAVLAEALPDMAGKWRTKSVQVGAHVPPEHWHVERMTRELFGDLDARIEHSGDDLDLQVEALAFAEAKILHVHPFADFNGRTARVLVLELVRRLDLPPVRSWADPSAPEYAEHKAALVEFDLYQTVDPMKQFWLGRMLGSAG